MVKHFCGSSNILRKYLGSSLKKRRILMLSENYGILIKKCVSKISKVIKKVKVLKRVAALENE